MILSFHPLRLFVLVTLQKKPGRILKIINSRHLPVGSFSYFAWRNARSSKCKWNNAKSVFYVLCWYLFNARCNWTWWNYKYTTHHQRRWMLNVQNLLLTQWWFDAYFYSLPLFYPFCVWVKKRTNHFFDPSYWVAIQFLCFSVSSNAHNWYY